MTEVLRCQRFGEGAGNLLVLLPGAYMKPEGFAAAGFFNSVRKRGLDLDLCTVDLDLATISGGQALALVRQQVLEPARAQYRQVWLGGISLGGFLSLAMAADHPEAIDGLCLLAPYPGSRVTTNAIERAGGLAAWTPEDGQLADPEFRVWRWLREAAGSLPAFVGYGREDRFAEGMGRLAACFPEPARRVVGGGHDWPAWRSLWDHFLDLGHFAHNAA